MEADLNPTSMQVGGRTWEKVGVYGSSLLLVEVGASCIAYFKLAWTVVEASKEVDVNGCKLSWTKMKVLKMDDAISVATSTDVN